MLAWAKSRPSSSLVFFERQKPKTFLESRRRVATQSGPIRGFGQEGEAKREKIGQVNDLGRDDGDDGGSRSWDQDYELHDGHYDLARARARND